MAYSDDTQAIIDRLTAEGDLIRNSGTNSVKSLNIKLEKFDGLFQSINANVIAQTEILRAQSGLASDAAERAKTQEQFDEIAQKEDIADKKESKDKKPLSEVGNKAGDAIAKGFNKIFTLKNMAAMGAIGFVGANFLKGFVEEYGGFREIFKDMGVSDDTFTTLDNIGPSVTDMKLKFDEFIGPEGPLTSMSNSLESLSTNLAELNATFESIKNLDWQAIAFAALYSLPLLGLTIKAAGAAASGLKLKFDMMRKDLDKATKPKGGRPWYYSFLGGVDDVPPPPKNYPNSAPPDDGSRAGQKPNPKPTAKKTGNGGPPGTTKGFANADVRADAAKVAPDKFKFDSKGRLQNVKGGFASDADALKYLEKTLDPKYSKIFKGLLKGAGILAVVISVYDAYKIYNILNNTDGSYDSDDKKIAGIGPIIGPLFTGFAAGAIGSAFGFMVGGPWGALGGGIVFGLAGSFASPDVFGIMLAKALFGLVPTNDDKKIITGQNVEPRPTASGVIGDYAKEAWDKKNKGKFDPMTGNQLTTKPLVNFGRGSVVEGRGERSEYVTRQSANELDALLQAETEMQKNEKLIEETREYLKQFGIEPTSSLTQRNPSKVLASFGTGAGGGMNINAPQISPVVINTHGGSNMVQTTNLIGGGGAGGMDGLSAFGLTHAIS